MATNNASGRGGAVNPFDSSKSPKPLSQRKTGGLSLVLLWLLAA